MARPVQHDVTKVALSTNDSNPTGLGVFQSLDVRARAPKSAQLASGLADVLGVAAPMMNDYIQKKSEDQTNEGIADATFGRVDDEKLKKGIAYQAGVEHTQVKQMQFEAQAAWKVEYEENVDKGLPTSEVVKMYDGFMKAHLGEIATSNPKLAAKLSPGFMKGMQETMVAHQTQLTKQHTDNAISVMQTEIAAAHERGEPVDFAQATGDVLAITGDMQATNTAAIKAIVQQGIAAGDPDFIKTIPVGDASFTADQRQFVEQGVEAATAAMIKKERFERGIVKADLLTDWQARIDAGMPPSDAEIMGQWEEADHGLFPDIDELIGWMHRANAKSREQKVGNEFAQLPKGAPYFTKIGTLRPDGSGEEYTKEDVQFQVNRDVEAQIAVEQARDPQATPAVLQARAVSRISEVEGFAFKPLKSVFDYAPLSEAGGQVYDNAASAFAALPVSQRALYVPDAEKRHEFETYLGKRDVMGAGRGGEIIAELTSRDPDLVKRTLTRHRTALNEANEKIPSLVLQDGFWNDIEVAEMFDAPYATRVIEDGTRDRVAGGQTVEEAQTNALKDFTSSHMLIVSPTGEKRSMLRIPGTSPKMGDAIAWMEELLPEVGKIKGVEIPKGARLRVDFMNRENNMLIIVDRNGQRVASEWRFPAANIERTFHEQNPQGEWSKRMERSRAMQKLRTTDITNPTTNPSLYNTRD